MIAENKTNADDVAELLNIEKADALAFLGSKIFLSVFREVRLNTHKYKFLSESLPFLETTVTNTTDKTVDRLKAVDIQTNILGFKKQSIDLNASVSIESLLDKISKNIDIDSVDVTTIEGLD